MKARDTKPAILCEDMACPYRHGCARWTGGLKQKAGQTVTATFRKPDGTCAAFSPRHRV